MIRKLSFKGYIWLFLAVLWGIKSIQMDVGTFSSPGPGFVPFTVALFLFSLSVILIVKGNLFAEEKLVERPDLKIGSLYIVCYIIGYVFLFKKIGYLFSTFLVMTFVLRSMGTRRWAWALGGAILVTLLSYLFFGVVLKLNLPTGIF